MELKCFKFSVFFEPELRILINFLTLKSYAANKI